MVTTAMSVSAGRPLDGPAAYASQGSGAVVIGRPVCPLPGELSDREVQPPARPGFRDYSSTAGVRVGALPMGRVVQPARVRQQGPDAEHGIVIGTIVGRPPQLMPQDSDGYPNLYHVSTSAPTQVAFAVRNSGNTVMVISGEDDYPAEDPTCLATLVCCVCPCWCVGLIAIAKSREVASANDRGEFSAAHERRKEALRLIYLTVALGVVVNVVYFILRQQSGDGGTNSSS